MPLAHNRLHAINDVLSPRAASVSHVFKAGRVASDVHVRFPSAPPRHFVHASRNKDDWNARLNWPSRYRWMGVGGPRGARARRLGGKLLDGQMLRAADDAARAPGLR